MYPHIRINCDQNHCIIEMIRRYSRKHFSSFSKAGPCNINSASAHNHLVVNHLQRKIFAREWRPSLETKLEPLILLHDSLGCVDLWRNFPGQLCAYSGRRVIAYDRLGFGLSDPHKEVIPLTFIEDESKIYLPSILDHFQVDKFIIFGHSVGGGMAVHCASRYSNRCVGLITESAQAFVEDRTIQGIEEAKRNFKDPKQLQKLFRYHGEKVNWVLDSWTESWLHPTFAHWSLKHVLPTVHCPTLVLHGENDEFGSIKHPEMISSLVKGPSSMNFMKSCGHVPHREKSVDVVKMVKQFLDSL